jgi:hypothetical protein
MWVYVFLDLFFMKNAQNVLGISPVCISHIVQRKEAASVYKPTTVTDYARTAVSKLLIEKGHKDGRKK